MAMNVCFQVGRLGDRARLHKLSGVATTHNTRRSG